MLPHGLLGRDYGGRPVLYKNVGQLDMSKLVDSGNDLSTVLKYNEWLLERLTHALDHQGTWVLIFDLAGLQLANIVSLKWLLHVQAMASHDAAHYPDRLHALYLINVPSFFGSFWQLISRFIGEEACSRISLLADESEWRPILEQAFDTSLLPRHLGGHTQLSLSGLCPTLTMSHSRKRRHPCPARQPSCACIHACDARIDMRQLSPCACPSSRLPLSSRHTAQELLSTPACA